MKKILGLIKRHIILFILCFLAFIVFVIMVIAFLKMTINSSGRYGNRLDGIEKVEVSKKDLKKITDSLKERDEIVKASARVQGKIIYFDIFFTESTSLDSAKSICSDILKEFDEEENNFYDFSFVITQEGDSEDKWSSIGSKNMASESISWNRR